MKLTRLIFAGAVCAMMAFATACSDKTQKSGDDNATATDTETVENNDAVVDASGVIELAAGQTLDVAQGKPVIVDFNATWCGPCKKFAPTFEEVAREYTGKALFYSVDVDVHPELAAEYGVTGIPHIQFIKPADTAANTSLVGLQTKEDFTKAIDAFLK